MEQFLFEGASPSAEAIRQMIRLADPVALDACLNVHAGDDMFSFTVGTTQAEALAAMAYFRAGLSITDSIRKLAAWRFGGLSKVGSFLDFAAGYGRSTRFLVRHMPAESVCVAEIQAEALEFQAEEFGVRTLRSETDPQAVRVERRYDIVFVSSLLTHVPERTFGPWLGKLWEFVADGGMLVFSVHDETVNDLGVELRDGFAFLPSTEVASLSTEDYGTNFTTAEFVRAKIGTHIGAEAAATAVRLTQALYFKQDIWAICRGELPLAELSFECGPTGALDELNYVEKSAVLHGWAADRGFSLGDRRSHRISDVAVYVSGELRAHTLVGSGERPDVAEHLGQPADELLRWSAWQVTLPASSISEDDVITVTATCEHNATFTLDSTRLGDLLARTGKPAFVERGLAAWRARLATAGQLARDGGGRAVLGHSVVLAGRAAVRLGDRISSAG